MRQPVLQLFRFGDYELDERLGELRKGGQRVELRRRPLQLLLYLVKHADRLVSRDELLREVWSGVKVAEGALRTALYDLRRTLDDPESTSQWIVTLPGRGCRFVGKIEVVNPHPASTA